MREAEAANPGVSGAVPACGASRVEKSNSNSPKRTFVDPMFGAAMATITHHHGMYLYIPPFSATRKTRAEPPTVVHDGR